VKPQRRLADMPFRQHGFEHRQQIKVGTSEMNVIQHIPEIISSNSFWSNRHQSASSETIHIGSPPQGCCDFNPLKI
jgi:hypothetical protein